MHVCIVSKQGAQGGRRVNGNGDTETLQVLRNMSNDMMSHNNY